ncbi:MAG: N-6 DNA methylase, partial [Planctomycetota bacterium]|nr:N-6 DNA methylase [Planctomycetota bacterium]
MTDKTKISQPFAKVYYNENTGTQKLIEWMKKIIADKNLGFGDIVFDTSSDLDGERPDAVIFERPQSQSILCLIEFKQPNIEHTNLKVTDKVHKEAKRRGAKYFATSNFLELIAYDTKDGQVIGWFTLSRIEALELIEDIRYKSQITTGMDKFLHKLYQLNTGKIVRPKSNLDELFRYYLQQKVETLSHYYAPIIRDRVHKDKTFSRDLRKWFVEQSWERSDDEEADYQKTARQAAYLLINKIIFYDALRAKNPTHFDKLVIPDDFTQSGLLQGYLQNYFNYVLRIDYETIYTTDFIDQIAFPDHREVVEAIKDLVNFLNRYDFSQLGVDIIGRIFERLIPEQERHELGQFFTNPDIVDIILRFCLRHETDKVFDPFCGTGTFLVRAYQHKKLMNPRLSHEDILKTIWGNDIAKFPAHLATINLAIIDLSVEKNYPYILRDDFFALTLGGIKFKEYEKLRHKDIKGLGETKIKIPYPHTVDCIVGNPPYTRQEEIPSTGVDKAKLIDNALAGPNGMPIATLSKRAGIHAYSFVHGFKFLDNGGRFGFIVSNSWMDVDYGKGLQEFFLNHAKIVTVIESKVERWFSDADVNTCIIILEKASGDISTKERDTNLVRFVQLKKKISELNIPSISDMWDTQKARLDAIDKLVDTIKYHDKYYENDDMRIFPKTQKELWAEGFDKEANTYIGAKWGKYIRAPKIFFNILKKCKDKLVPLKEIADVTGGIITGNNKFFYFGKKSTEIEDKFLRPVIKTPRELTKIVFTKKDLKYRILFCDKDKKFLRGTKLLKYIQKAEKRGIQNGETFSNRDNWYSLPEKKAKLLWVDIRRAKHLVHINRDHILFEHNFYGLNPKQSSQLYTIAGILNSTYTWLLVE